ncbi:MAG: TetR/AcrR family transcriptional regulator [Desulfobacteraceae bacterium]|jgi:AcrR family transcriptional regulator
MKNSAIRKKKLIKAATKIFAMKGFDHATMDEIAEAAKVTKGALYYNYASKSHLFVAVVTDGMEEIMEQISLELESDLPFNEHFQLLISNIIRIFRNNKEVIWIYANDLSSGISPEALEEIEKVRQRFFRFVTDALEAGQEKGYLKPLHRQISATVLVGMMAAFCTNRLGPEENYDLKEIIETVIPILSWGSWQQKSDC